MGAVRHLVARQTVEILTADRAEGEALAARTSGAAGRLAAAIEHGLDAVDAAGLDLRIDRIELDLGPCETARWEDALADGIRETLAAKVAEAVDRGDAVHRDAGAAALLLLDAFGRSGRLPWWAAGGDRPESAIALLASVDCDSTAVRAILARPEAVERFVNQLDERNLLSLLRLAVPDLPDDAALAIAALVQAQPAPGAESVRAGRAAAWRAILAEAADAGATRPHAGAGPWHRPGEGVADFERFLAAVATRLGLPAAQSVEFDGPDTEGTKRDADGFADSPHRSLPPEEPVTALPERLSALARRYPSTAALFGGLSALAPQLSGGAARMVEGLLDSGAPIDLPALLAIFIDAGAIRADEAERWRDLVAAARAHPDGEAHDAVAVANSGLVLLWPFLPQFFGSFGLLEDERFRDVAAQHRAAALLHYLAGGEVAVPEQDLPLTKILAGMDIDAVHDPGQPLEAFETGPADALLEAMLGHAPMLGRISVGGLRQAFLMRPGLLSTRDGHWLLRVERHSIDVLLDRLPWSFAWVRLPWMSDPLQIEW